MTSMEPPAKKAKNETRASYGKFYGPQGGDRQVKNELWRMFRLAPRETWTVASFKDYHRNLHFKTGKSMIGHTKKERAYRNFLRTMPDQTPGTSAGVALVKHNMEKEKPGPAVANYFPRWYTMKDTPVPKAETEFTFDEKVEVAAIGMSAFVDSLRRLWLKFCKAKNLEATPRSFTLFLSKYGEDLPVAGIIVEVIKLMADGIGKRTLVPSETDIKCTCATCPSHSMHGSILEPIPDFSDEDMDDILGLDMPVLDSPDPFDVLDALFADDGDAGLEAAI